MKVDTSMHRLRTPALRRALSTALTMCLGATLLLISRAAPFGAAHAEVASVAPGPPAAASEQGNPSISPERDLAMKITEPFTFAAAGEVIMRVPMGQLADRRFQDLIDHLRNADVAFTNMEGPLMDVDTVVPHVQGQAAPKGALRDLQSWGIDLMSTANDHGAENLEDLYETIRLLTEGGIVYAGTGRNLQEARAARFMNTPKGTVGLVGMYSTDPGDHAMATYDDGVTGGRPGLNAVRVTHQGVVTAEQMEELRKIRDSIYARRGEVFAPIPPLPADAPKDRLQLFEQHFIVGPKPGDVEYQMNAGDVHEIMRSIRNGKQYSDFMVASVHSHQGDYAFQTYTYDNDTPQFMIELAHQAIDNGADVFVGHGVHTIRGIDIYKGRPIFYGLQTFVYQYQSARPLNPLSNVGHYRDPRTADMTDAEATMRPGGWAAVRVAQSERMEALLPVCRYENGQLVEVRVYPVDLGRDLTRPFSRLGIPMTPSAENAQRILQLTQRLSKPFGTEMSIENGVGVIRVAKN